MRRGDYILKKNLKVVAAVMAVSVLSVNVFGSGTHSYAGQVSRQDSSLSEEVDGEGDMDKGGPEASQKSNEEKGMAGSPEEDGAGSQGNQANVTDSQEGSAGSQGDAAASQEGNSTGSQESSIDSPENATDSKEDSTGSQGNVADSQEGSAGTQANSTVSSGNVTDSQENSKEDQAGELFRNAQEPQGQDSLQMSFAELIAEYDLYAMLSNGKELRIRSLPSESAGLTHTLPSGYQVKLTGAALGEDGALWFQVEYGFQDAAYSGFIQDAYVVTQDARLQEWKAAIQDARMFGLDRSVRGAAGNTDLSAFPKSYRTYIKSLTAAHPNWTFVPMNTGLDWKEVLRNENGESVNLVDGGDPMTLVTWKSTKDGCYDRSTGKWIVKEGNTWVQASESIIKYYMDPRNFLNEDSVFQFEQLTYNSAYHTEAGVEKVLSGTFMSHKVLGDKSGEGKNLTYAQAFMKIGQELKVSPFFLASRVRQEQGVSGNSALISGTYPGYKGYYNYFNRQATGIGEAVIINGLKEAKSKGWNTRYKALKGGAESVSSDYIAKGQDTFYLQKFDVDGSYNGLYWHQYMQNLLAADHEGKSVRKSYAEMGTIDNSFVFKVPVYNNMPSSACKKPGEKLSKPSVSVSKTGDTSVKVSWKEVPGAEGYHIFRAENNGAYSRIKSVTGLEKVSYTDKKAVPGKLYSYKVRAYLKLYGGNMRSSYSAAKEVDLRVPKPTWKSLKVKKYSTAVLSWNKQDVTGYRIYRKTGNGAYKKLKTISGASVTSFKDTTIQPGNTYTYRIRCYRKINGVAYFSSYSKVKTIKVSMSAASLTKAAVSSGSKIKLSWKQDARADGYQVYRADAPDGKFVRVKTISSPDKLKWWDAAVSEGKSYSYKIRTYSKTSQGTKTSKFSKVLTVSTALQKPVLKAAKPVSKGIKVTWKKAQNAAGYKVYRSLSKTGNYKVVKKFTDNGTVAWTDKNVVKGKTYYYRIKSFSAYNAREKNSVYSKRLSVKNT